MSVGEKVQVQIFFISSCNAMKVNSKNKFFLKTIIPNFIDFIEVT